ncbi:MAG: class I SAM-dependent methyltransferase [Calditrichaeota bacterium]|nr:MAG: class I SAM-dependent methyltransferase [Calditrichota bacterium]MBL1206985.1 class I SAM-dependent methyltransferase [Calditrichota bacterium]NOG46812.1 class I SAM-dependent methyltransferase [Calditrichota bacterium]
MKNIIKKILQSGKNTNLELDEFTQRILCTVPGMLETGNLESFEYVAKHLSSKKPVLEIGSFCGLSFILLRYFLDKNNKPNKIFTCDDWSYEGFFDKNPSGIQDGDLEAYMEIVGGNKNIRRENYVRFTKSQFKNNALFFSSHNMPASFHLSSNLFFSYWKEGSAMRDIFGNESRLGGPLSFVYIDGDHSYEQCRKDFQNADIFLGHGGFLLLDDSADGGIFGSSQVAKEVEAHSDYELIMKNPNYLFKKVK